MPNKLTSNDVGPGSINGGDGASAILLLPGTCGQPRLFSMLKNRAAQSVTLLSQPADMSSCSPVVMSKGMGRQRVIVLVPKSHVLISRLSVRALFGPVANRMVPAAKCASGASVPVVTVNQ